MKNIFLSLFIILNVGCGGGSSSTTPLETDVESVEHIFEKQELFTPSLKLLNGSKQYEISKLDPINVNLSSLYYDFSSKKFKNFLVEKQIFVNGNRASYLDIDYELNSKGEVITTLNQEKIYSLSSLTNKKVINQKTRIYKNDINITGEVHQVSKKYLSNFFVVDDLFSNQIFNDLNEFTQAYRLKPFTGSYLRGLVFFNDNKLQEYNEGNYTDAGTYAIKKIDQQDVLFIYPTNQEHYYAKDSCYILDFSRVWKAKCYEKNTKEKKVFYDQEVYDDILNYLKESFISVNINI